MFSALVPMLAFLEAIHQHYVGDAANAIANDWRTRDVTWAHSSALCGLSKK